MNKQDTHKVGVRKDYDSKHIFVTKASIEPLFGNRSLVQATARGHLVFEKGTRESAGRKRYAAAFKTKAVLETLKGERTVAAPPEKFEVHPTLTHQGSRRDWKTIQ